MGKYKNPASAAASWAIVRKKLLTNNTDPTPEPTPKSAAKTGGDRIAHDDDNNGIAQFTPINTPKKKNRGVKKEERINPKTEEDENAEVAPTGVSSPVTSHQSGDTIIKTEDKEGEVVTPALSKPTKKRTLKAKDENGTPTKRAKKAVNGTTTSAFIIPDHKEVSPTATIVVANDADSNGLVEEETPSEAPKTQGI